MTNTTKRRIASVERYANALFQLAKEAKVLETVSSELTKLRNLMEQDIKMMSVVQNPSISKNRKINFFNLSEKEIKDIKSQLKDKFNSDFNIKIIVDKSLIGGLKIQVGSQMIDSSIKNQLQLLKVKMKEVA